MVQGTGKMRLKIAEQSGSACISTTMTKAPETRLLKQGWMDRRRKVCLRGEALLMLIKERRKQGQHGEKVGNRKNRKKFTKT